MGYINLQSRSRMHTMRGARNLAFPGSLPQQNIQVNQNHWASKGLKSAIVARNGYLVDVLYGETPSQHAPTSTIVAQNGLCPYYNGSADSITQFAHDDKRGLVDGSGITIVCAGRVVSLNNSSFLAGYQQAPATNGWELRLGASGVGLNDASLLFHKANSSYYRQHVGNNGQQVTNGNEFVFSVTQKGILLETAPTFAFKNSSQQVKIWTSAPIYPYGTGAMTEHSSSTLRFSARIASATYFNGGISTLLLYNREMSDGELRDITANPFLWAKPIQKSSYKVYITLYSILEHPGAFIHVTGSDSDLQAFQHVLIDSGARKRMIYVGGPESDFSSNLIFYPYLVFPNYSSDGSSITIPITDIPGLTVMAADASSGDSRQLIQSLFTRFHEYLSDTGGIVEKPKTVSTFMLEDWARKDERFGRHTKRLFLFEFTVENIPTNIFDTE